MKIYVVGSSRNNFLPLDNIREKFLVDIQHEGDNMDSLNPWLCELSGLYYLWKHVNDDIVGLEHYRRYFVNDTYVRSTNLVRENEIRNILNSHDIIVCEQHTGIWGNPRSFWSKYGLGGQLNNFKKFLAIMSVYYPDFTQFFKQWFERANHIYSNNMYITRKEISDEWCELVFTCVKIYQENFPLDSSNLRIFGWFTETLLGAWVEFKKLKVCVKPRNMLGK